MRGGPILVGFESFQTAVQLKPCQAHDTHGKENVVRHDVSLFFVSILEEQRDVIHYDTHHRHHYTGA